MFSKKRIKYCTFEEFEEALKFAQKFYDIIEGPRPREAYYFNAYIEVKRTVVELTYKRGKQVCTYHFRLDGQDDIRQTNGMEAYKILKQYCPELPDLSQDEFYGYTNTPDFGAKYGWRNEIANCTATLGFNEKNVNTRHDDCYGYDLNSAWNYAMLQPMPDTSEHPEMFKTVEKGEIGFNYDDNGNFRLVEEGRLGIFVFKEIESPFKRFVQVWYDRKKNAKDKREKMKAKNVLTYSIGYLQRKNPFIRAAIICRANKYINSLIDENTLYWNTDSIISTVKRPDIECNIGKEIGQWKLEHSGSFAYTGYSYQWNGDIPCVRGIPKKWFETQYPNGFDILKDKLPNFGNVYYIDKDDNYSIKRCNYEEI